MNAELLKYFTALQPLFREKMGPWRVGDKTWYCGVVQVVIFNDHGWLNLFNVSYEETFEIYTRRNCDNLLRLPADIDYDGPDGKPSGRCLWGMVDWNRFEFYIARSGKMQAWERKSRDPLFGDDFNFSTLALLKTLAAQEGVGVKG